MVGRVLLLIVLISAAVTGGGRAQADNGAVVMEGFGKWYIGAGVDFTAVKSTEKVYTDGEEWPALSLVGGHRLNNYLYLELLYKIGLASDLASEILAVGPRVNFLDLDKSLVIPWAAVYISHVSLDWEEDSVHMDSLSLCASGGMDLRTSRGGFIQTAIRYYSFRADLEQFATVIFDDSRTRLYEFTVQYVHMF